MTEARAADSAETVLSITGSPGARVSGRCLVAEGDDEREVRLDQAVPVEHRWRARRVRCELEAQGSVVVEVVRGGTRDTHSTSGGRITFDVS